MVLGIALLVWPATSLRLVCAGFGIVILVKGAASIVGYFRSEERFFSTHFSLVFGILAFALGVFLLVRPDTVVKVLPLLVGLFILFDGVLRLQYAFDLRRAGFDRWWSYLLLSLLSAALGGLMVWNPFTTAQVMVQAIGIILVVEGVLNLVSALYARWMLRRLAEAVETVVEEAAEAAGLTELDLEAEQPTQDGEGPIDVDYREL